MPRACTHTPPNDLARTGAPRSLVNTKRSVGKAREVRGQCVNELLIHLHRSAQEVDAIDSEAPQLARAESQPRAGDGPR